MATTSIFLILVVVITVKGQAVNQILTDGASGNTVVDATVSRILQTCIFGDDKRFLRRLATVETLDGTGVSAFNGGRNGGIWKISATMFNALGNGALSAFKSSISSKLNINWASVTYNDLRKPLYSGLAAAMYTRYILATDSRVSEIPRSISDQANFWATYYRPGSSASDFVNRATAFETSRATCNVGADIVFVIDESGSIGGSNYVTEKDFVTEVIKRLNIGPTANQVGVITYSTSTTLDIPLGRYNDRNALINAVTQLPYSGGGTNTYLALRQMIDVAFASGNGARPRGRGHPRVGIVLTDGISSSAQNTLAEAARAKNAGLIMFSVGVGRNVRVSELVGMASTPTCLHYSQLNSGFSEILDLVSSISATTCSVAVTFKPGDTLVRPVDSGVHYNCEITIPPNGVTVQLTTSRGDLTLFLSNTSYPSLAYYDAKISVKLGTSASVYIPPGNGIAFCSLLSDARTNVTIVTKPGKLELSSYNCAAGRSPCTLQNIARRGSLFPHESQSRYIQCGGPGICHDMNCPSGLVWDPSTRTCNWPGSLGSGSSGGSPGPSGSGLTCPPPTPCTSVNIASNGYYYAHSDPTKFIQCDDHGQCFVMPCGTGRRWADALKTCD